MACYRQLLYHLVFRTKNSIPSIDQDHAEQLYSYISGIIRNKNSHLYRINDTENHLHILTDLHPSVALADFMRELKASTSKWIKEKGLFPLFDGWAEGYGSFTCSYCDLGGLIEYIRNQQEHHKKKSFSCREAAGSSMLLRSMSWPGSCVMGGRSSDPYRLVPVEHVNVR